MADKKGGPPKGPDPNAIVPAQQVQPAAITLDKRAQLAKAVAEKSPENLANHINETNFEVRAMSPDEFMDKHSSTTFDLQGLFDDFKEVCPDFEEDFGQSSRARFCIGFCSDIIFTVGPESRKLKKDSRDKSWCFVFGEGEQAKYVYIATFKNDETKVNYERKDRSVLCLTMKQASLISVEILSRLVTVIQRDGKSKDKIVLTPLAGAIFSRNDMATMAHMMGKTLSEGINAVNRSCQSGSQYFPIGKVSSEVAVVAAITATRNMKSKSTRESIITKTLKQYLNNDHPFDRELLKALSIFANCGLPDGITADTLITDYESAKKQTDVADLRNLYKTYYQTIDKPGNQGGRGPHGGNPPGGNPPGNQGGAPPKGKNPPPGFLPINKGSTSRPVLPTTTAPPSVLKQGQSARKRKVEGLVMPSMSEMRTAIESLERADPVDMERNILKLAALQGPSIVIPEEDTDVPAPKSPRHEPSRQQKQSVLADVHAPDEDIFVQDNDDYQDHEERHMVGETTAHSMQLGEEASNGEQSDNLSSSSFDIRSLLTVSTEDSDYNHKQKKTPLAYDKKSLKRTDRADRYEARRDVRRNSYSAASHPEVRKFIAQMDNIHDLSTFNSGDKLQTMVSMYMLGFVPGDMVHLREQVCMGNPNITKPVRVFLSLSRRDCEMMYEQGCTDSITFPRHDEVEVTSNQPQPSVPTGTE